MTRANQHYYVQIDKTNRDVRYLIETLKSRRVPKAQIAKEVLELVQRRELTLADLELHDIDKLKDYTMSKDDKYSKNNWRIFEKIEREVEVLYAEKYSNNDIAAHITWRLFNAGLTLQQFEDWKAGYHRDLQYGIVRITVNTPDCESGNDSSTLLRYPNLKEYILMAYDAFMTPPSELAIAREYLGGITLDPASSIIAAPYVQAKYFAISPEEFAQCMYKQYENVSGSILNVDGLDKAWHGTVWLNPPYSKGLIDAFVNKAIHEWQQRDIDRMLILVNSQTDTKWYHALANNATRIFHYRGRLKFWKMQDGKAWEKWEGEESIKRRTLDPTQKAKIGNSPRYLNTLFLFETDGNRLGLFRALYGHRGIISIPER